MNVFIQEPGGSTDQSLTHTARSVRCNKHTKACSGIMHRDLVAQRTDKDISRLCLRHMSWPELQILDGDKSRIGKIRPDRTLALFLHVRWQASSIGKKCSGMIVGAKAGKPPDTSI